MFAISLRLWYKYLFYRSKCLRCKMESSIESTIISQLRAHDQNLRNTNDSFKWFVTHFTEVFFFLLLAGNLYDFFFWCAEGKNNKWFSWFFIDTKAKNFPITQIAAFQIWCDILIIASNHEILLISISLCTRTYKLHQYKTVRMSSLKLRSLHIDWLLRQKFN